MRKIGRRLLVLLGIFLIAATAFAFHLHISEEPEVAPSYEIWESAALPVISGEVGAQRINILHGNVSEIDVYNQEISVMPVDESGQLNLVVTPYESSISSMTYEVTSRDGQTELSHGEISGLKREGSEIPLELRLGNVLEEGQEAMLRLILTLQDGRSVNYYTRVILGEELHAEEMLDYVLDFHQDTFDEKAAEKYAANLEQNGTADTTTLADVSIHSSFRQLTWGNLGVQGDENLSCQILNLDGNFGSFLLEYEVTSEDEDAFVHRYLVSEYFSVQWTSTRFYLMNYHRTMEELFQADEAHWKKGSLELGINTQSKISRKSSEDENVIAFTTAGELWSYRKSNNTMVQIFTFRDDDDGVRSGYRQYDVKPLSVETNGDVSFLVYGYMNRGRHEGETGVCCLRYEAESNTLAEIFFLPYTGSYSMLKKGIETLACMGGNHQVYLMVGDAVYSVDWEGAEMVILANQIHNRNLVVNDTQTAIAWELDQPEASSQRIQILYLETGESNIMEVGDGDWISPQGFIDDDCIVGIGHQGDETVSGVERVNPFYRIVIQSRENQEEARYEYENVYISSVNVREGQVELARMQKNADGSFSSIQSDTLIQNVSAENVSTLKLSSRNEERRAKVWYLPVTEASKAPVKTDFEAPTMVTYTESEAFHFSPVVNEESQLQYYAYSEGNLVDVVQTAGEAIGLVYDKMGTVLDSRGRLVWYRTSRQAAVSGAGDYEGSTMSGSLRACLQIIADREGITLHSESEGTTLSAMDEMEALFPGRALNLTGSPMRALLYFVNQGHPVILVDENQKAILLVGFDLYNVEYYDPVLGETYKQGQQDATDYLAGGQISCIGYLVE